MADLRQNTGALAMPNGSGAEHVYRRELAQLRRLPTLITNAETGDDQEEDGEQAILSEEEYLDLDDADREELMMAQSQAQLNQNDRLALAEFQQNQEEALADEEEEESLADTIKSGSWIKQSAYTQLAGQARAEIRQKAIQQLASRLAIAKVAAAATLIGIVITYLIMTFQFIGGNWLQNHNIPKLSYLEIIAWSLLSVALLLVVVIAFVLVIIMVAIMMGPVFALGLLGQTIVDLIF